MTQVDPPAPKADASDRPALILRIETGLVSRRIPLERPRLVVGRADDCDIVLDDRTVSRRHAVLEVEGGQVSFRDLGGTNPLWLDGAPARAGLLMPGATLLIGMTRLRVEQAAATVAVRSLDHGEPTAIVLRSAAADRGLDLRVAVLRALTRAPLGGSDLVAELGAHLLDAALALTGRSRGALLLTPAEAPPRVLASVPADPAAFALPEQALQALDGPLCVAPWPAGPAAHERLVAPLGSHFPGALVLGAPRADAPSSEVALPIAAALAGLAAVELHDAADRCRERRELEQLRHERSFPARAVRASSRLHGLRRQIADAARANLPLLLLGEEGCEVEELAIYYHEHSPRAAGPFVRCYARLLPPHRIAQELGTRDGVQEGPGTCCERARSGTLFVDSPEALRPPMQGRLAEVLSAGLAPAEGPHFVPVVSLLCDEDRRPELEAPLAALLEGFVVAAVPPLRAFPQDVVALCEVVLDDAGPTAGGRPRQLTEAAERLLSGYHWPGNVRQLCRAVETAAARAGEAPIDVRHLPQEIRDATDRGARTPTLREIEREHVLRVLALCGDNKSRAARALDISPSTLHEKLRRYGIAAGDAD